ncbi:12820_t:CDS:2 [Funneliformis geosporum]|uniref:12820_t:CDS:1 n=1 Tax=Funneliformis geosporum TaxID=1117311 RepID=A0A9W4STW7_9GLOM|nr:12820_t:CDS:2 [Funneliformis geosporum]
MSTTSSSKEINNDIVMTKNIISVSDIKTKTNDNHSPNTNNINIRHIATTSPVIIKNFFTVRRKRINNDIKIEPMENSHFSNSRCSLPILNKPQLQNNDVDRCEIISDDLTTKKQHCCKQSSQSRIQRLKRTLSLSKNLDREEGENIICCTNDKIMKSSDSMIPLNNSSTKENYPIQFLPRSLVMNPEDIDDYMNAQPQNNNCTCSDGTRKRVKSNNNRCATFFSQLSSTSPVSSTDDDSSAESSANLPKINVCDSIIVESRDQFIPTVAQKKRNSLDERTSNNIRRSWSHIEVRHIKGLFKRNRDSGDVKRRNSYAHTSSTRANQQIASESELKMLNHVHNIDNASNSDELLTSADEIIHSSPKKLPLDLYTLQADMEKETDAVTRARQMRKFIISEIYSTEQSYLAHMRTLKKSFMDPCIQASLTPHPFMNKDDVAIIFAHINELIKLSDTIVETIETSTDPWEDYDSKLGQVFLKYGNEFEVFEKYAENIQRSRQLLAKKVNQSVLYRKFVSSQRKKENIKLNLNDYMIMPIQRITRYSLLLKELKKYTLESHTDYKDMCEALDSMLSLASRCNDNIQ